VIIFLVATALKLSTLTWWADVTLDADLGAADATTDQVYAAMDWLQARQDAIEAKLRRRPAHHRRTGGRLTGEADLTGNKVKTY
jgi:hypothetical protein